MTQDEIIKMLRASCDKDKVDPEQNGFWVIHTPELEAFAKLVAEHEREACAKIVEEHAKAYAKLEKNPATSAAWAACIDIHDSISERGDV
jgi:hypothetical protein